MTNISTRASRILKQRKAEWQRQFKACHGNTMKVKAASKDFHKKYGATPKARWKRALKDASKVNKDTQVKMRFR